MSNENTPTNDITQYTCKHVGQRAFRTDSSRDSYFSKPYNPTAAIPSDHILNIALETDIANQSRLEIKIPTHYCQHPNEAMRPRRPIRGSIREDGIKICLYSVEVEDFKCPYRETAKVDENV